MNTPAKRKIVAATAAALAVGGAGAALAATQLGRSPSEESKAVVSDAAQQLGVQPSELSSALKKALKDRVDAAVAAGRMSKDQGNELKKRIDSDEFPLFAGPGFGFRHFGHHGFGHHGFGFHGLSGVATYLGLSESRLRDKLESGKTLAEVAKAQGKSVEGLVSTMQKGLKQKLDEAVKDGRLTKSQEARILKGSEQGITAMVNGKLPAPPRGDRGWFRGRPGFGSEGGPPAGAPQT